MSTIIKAAGPIRTLDGVTFNFDDMAVKANQYLDQVRADAGKIIAKAEQDAAAIRAKAAEEGKQAALRAAERILDEKVGKQMATLLPALKQAVAELQTAKQVWLGHWEKIALEVAAAMAARVVRGELTRQPDVPIKLVREALELAAGSPRITIHLHPEDHATLGGQCLRLAQEIAKVAQAELVADAGITRGGCRIDTRFGQIDQQIESQLDRIQQELSAT